MTDAADSDSGPLAALPSLDAVGVIFHDISDVRVLRAILKRAEGHSWKVVAQAAGVEERTIYHWKHQWGLDERAAMLAMEAAKQGALRFVSTYNRAAEFIAKTVDDESAKTTERLSASKTVVTEAHRMALSLQERIARAPTTKRPEDEPEAIEAAADDRPAVAGLSARIRERRRAKRSAED